MICGVQSTFRILDPIVGWEVSCSPEPFALDDVGLRLDLESFRRIPLRFIAPYIPPPWFAYNRKHKDRFVCGQQGSDGNFDAFLMRRDSCSDGWQPLLDRLQAGHEVTNPVAISSGHGRLVILEKGEQCNRLFVWSIPDGKLVGRQVVANSQECESIVAVTPWGEIVVIHLGEKNSLYFDRLDFSAQQPRRWKHELEPPIDLEDFHLRATLGRNGDLILAVGGTTDKVPEPVFQIFSIKPKNDSQWCNQPVDFDVESLTADLALEPERLSERCFPTGIVVEQDDCVGIDDSGSAGQPSTTFICRNGGRPDRPISPVVFPTEEGELILGPIKSEMGRVEWHRVRADVESDSEGGFRIDVQTCDKESESDLDIDFWQESEEDSDDFLINQPAAENLFLRVRLTGGVRSPLIKRIRIDFPRRTSLDLLPAVFRQDPKAEDFTARFLSVFDAEMELLDEAVEGLPSMFGIENASADILPWLGDFLAIDVDRNWSEFQRRQILAAAPKLYETRGTAEGLRQALGLLLEMDPEQIVIRERAQGRSFGMISQNTHLGTTRLFGMSAARLRLGASPLGVAGMNTYGNPDEDFVRQDAHRFDVLIPPIYENREAKQSLVAAAVENLKPAHTQHTLRIGGEGFILGERSVVGIDTQFVAPGEVVLSGSNDGDKSNGIRLGEGVLRPGPHRPTSGLNLGVSSNIGINTTLE